MVFFTVFIYSLLTLYPLARSAAVPKQCNFGTLGPRLMEGKMKYFENPAIFANVEQLIPVLGLGESIWMERIRERIGKCIGEENFFGIIQFMMERASNFCSLFPNGLEALSPDSTRMLTEKQVSCILANIFFNNFPERGSEFPRISNGFFTNANNERIFLAQIKAFTNYFSVLKHLENMSLLGTPERLISFTRISAAAPEWDKSDKPLCPVTVNNRKTIFATDLQNEYLQIDFANKSIGGGVLTTGCVQEEIHFLTHPDAIAGRAFIPNMEANEAIVIRGAKKISEYSGYSRDNFKITGISPNLEHEVPGLDNHIQRTLVAIDALNFSGPRTGEMREKLNETAPGSVHRELAKAYAGFQKLILPERGIATGFWGCGIFSGTKSIKAIIQWLAVSESERKDMYFCAIGDNDGKFSNDFRSFVEIIRGKKITVKGLYEILITKMRNPEHPNKDMNMSGFYKYISDLLQE